MNSMIKIFRKIPLSIFALVFSASLPLYAGAQNADPLKILMITGGGPWHDYETQKDQIREGLLERLSNIE
ncbi:MAG: hypothetical protein RLN82_03250, partial [Pseudomonadales bacterium]